jgi:hypothetical protein
MSAAAAAAANNECGSSSGSGGSSMVGRCMMREAAAGVVAVFCACTSCLVVTGGGSWLFQQLAVGLVAHNMSNAERHSSSCKQQLKSLQVEAADSLATCKGCMSVCIWPCAVLLIRREMYDAYHHVGMPQMCCNIYCSCGWQVFLAAVRGLQQQGCSSRGGAGKTCLCGIDCIGCSR